MNISENAKKLFLEYADDAGNWNGTPLIGGNIKSDISHRGYLTQLKKLGLISTFEYDGDMWIEFSESGVQYAKENGIHIPS